MPYRDRFDLVCTDLQRYQPFSDWLVPFFNGWKMMAGSLRKGKERVTHLLMFLCALLVSTSFPVGEHIAESLDPAVITLVRFLAAAAVLLPVIVARFGLRIDIRSLARYSLISGALVAFFWCMFLSLRYTSAFNTSVLFTSVPALSFLYSKLLVRERLGGRKIAALLVCFFGALWVIFKGDPRLVSGMSWNKGDLIFFAGCLAMGLYTPLIKKLHRGESMELMTFWVLVTGIFWLLPFAGVKLATVAWSQVPVHIWGWILYLSLFTTVVSFYLTQLSIPVIGPTRVMAYSYLYPALVLVIDIIIGKGWPPDECDSRCGAHPHINGDPATA